MRREVAMPIAIQAEVSGSAPAILAESLRRHFGATSALDGLSLSVPKGETFGLVGPDGAGKTTALRILAGILKPDGGTARVLGVDVVREPARVQERVGYMSQRFGLYADLTVQENLDFYADLYGLETRARAPRMAHLLDFSGLAPFRKRAAGNLSGGMKQKLGLACALLHTPEVLLLDEPTNGVDPVSRRDFWRILDGLQREGVTLLVATSYLDEAERCTQVGLLHRGRLVSSGPPADLKRQMPGTLLELRGPHVRSAAAALREAFPTWAVGLFGDRVHIGLPGGGPGAHELEAALTARRIPWASVRAIDPSLEDLFLSLLREDSP